MQNFDNDQAKRFEPKANTMNGFSMRKATGRMPEVLPTPLFLNLGCGRDIREGFINIDLFSDNPRVVGMDIRHLELPDGCADGLLASDILEHFSHRETQNILKEWHRVLKPGGELLIRCPSLRLQARTYLNGTWDADIASFMIFGGQTNPGDFHCNGFDESSIKKHLEAVGFEVVEVKETDVPQDRGFINLNMTVVSKKKAMEKPISNNLFAGLNFELQNGGNQMKPEKPQEEAQPVAVSQADEPAINIVWEGSQFVYHSLALINREQCSNLIDADVAEITIIPYEQDQFSPSGNPKYEKLKKNDIRYKADTPANTKKKPYAWIRHHWPPNPEPPKGAKWIINQPWEYSQLQRDIAEIFNQADEIWTPSTYSRKCMINSGVDFNKVQVIPNGVDPLMFTPKGNKYNLQTNKKLKFLFIGGTIFRKGIDILLKAYTNTFSSRDNVCLVIKDMGGDTFYKGQTAGEYIEKLRQKPDAPEIIYYDSYFSEQQIADLYRACDVFVCSYRGEGFSLPTLEAMACGLPVVVTKGGATDDFVDDEVAWLINAERRSVGSKLGDKQLTGEAFLLEPDLKNLCEILLDIYSNPNNIAYKGLTASYRARTIWTWKRSTMKVLSRLDALYGTSMSMKAKDTLVDNPDGYTYLCKAETSFLNGGYDAALADYYSAYYSPDLTVLHKIHSLNRMASIYILQNKLPLAEDFLNIAEGLSRDNPDTIYLQSALYAKKQEWAESLETLQVLLKNWQTLKFESTIGISLDMLLSTSAEGILNLGDVEGALNVFTEALRLNNYNAEACYGSAMCFLAYGEQEEARKMLEWAIRLKPDFKEALQAMEVINAKNGSLVS